TVENHTPAYLHRAVTSTAITVIQRSRYSSFSLEAGKSLGNCAQPPSACPSAAVFMLDSVASTPTPFTNRFISLKSAQIAVASCTARSSQPAENISSVSATVILPGESVSLPTKAKTGRILWSTSPNPDPEKISEIASV